MHTILLVRGGKRIIVPVVHARLDYVLVQEGEETIVVGVPTFRSTLPVGGDRPMHRTVQEDNI